MRFDFLSEPVSEAEPTGPDLDEALDTEYINITANASALLPERFYDRNREQVFDRGTIDINVQEKALARLMARTRDIRLLVLEARLQILAGRLVEFSDALQGILIVVSTFWSDFHPKEPDEDPIMRQNTLAGLDDTAVVIPALQSAPVIEGRSRVSYRNYLVSTGKIAPWANEEVIDRDAVERSLRPRPDGRNEALVAEANAQLTKAHTAVANALVALEAIRNVVIEKAGHIAAPSFDRLNDTLTAMKLFLEDFLGITDAAAEAAAAAELAEASGDDTGGGPARPTGKVANHAAARAALAATEDYFVRMEPSSPALILVHQARLLIGQPFVAALEALLPEQSVRAVLRFDGAFRFDIDLGRMKFVTEDMLANLPAIESSQSESSESTSDDDGWSTSSSDDDGWSSADSESTSEEEASEEPSDGEESVGEDSEEAPAAPPARTAIARMPEAASDGAVPTFTVATRQEVSALIGTVESFFRVAEPSSPVAVLLSRARTYIGKDFNAILSEMMPPPVAE